MDLADLQTLRRSAVRKRNELTSIPGVKDEEVALAVVEVALIDDRISATSRAAEVGRAQTLRAATATPGDRSAAAVIDFYQQARTALIAPPVTRDRSTAASARAPMTERQRDDARASMRKALAEVGVGDPGDGSGNEARANMVRMLGDMGIQPKDRRCEQHAD